MTAIAIAGLVAVGFIFDMQFDGDAAANLLFERGIDPIGGLIG